MSGVQMPKWKSYTLPSVESFHILRAPPSSIHTRKKERVDMSDVSYMIRNDDTRINEGVAYLARGTNPMVDVSYNNSGGGSRTNTMANVQASNPYKVMRNGAFRPPQYRQSDLQALSRQRRPETAAITNPGLRSGFNIHNLEDVMDSSEVDKSINREIIHYIGRPNAQYRMETPVEVYTGKRGINDASLQFSTVTGVAGPADYDTSRTMITNTPSAASRDARLTAASANPTSELYDIGRYSIDNPSAANRVSLPVSGTTNVAMRGDIPRYSIDNPSAAGKMTTLTAAHTNINGQSDVPRHSIDNPSAARQFTTQISAGTAVTANTDLQRVSTIDSNNYIKDNIILKNISSNFSITLVDVSDKNQSSTVHSNIKDKINIAVQTSLGAPISLTRSDGSQIKVRDYRWKVVNSSVGADNLVLYVHNTPELQLEKNIPLYTVNSNNSGYTRDERLATADPLMADRVATSAGSAVSMRYGRQEAIHDTAHNVSVGGMGSVGSIDNIGVIPAILAHNIPRIDSQNMTVRQIASAQMGDRYDSR